MDQSHQNDASGEVHVDDTPAVLDEECGDSRKSADDAHENNHSHSHSHSHSHAHSHGHEHGHRHEHDDHHHDCGHDPRQHDDTHAAQPESKLNTAEENADNPHTCGVQCGHPAVLHNGHVGYLKDGKLFCQMKTIDGDSITRIHAVSPHTHSVCDRPHTHVEDGKKLDFDTQQVDWKAKAHRVKHGDHVDYLIGDTVYTEDGITHGHLDVLDDDEVAQSGVIIQHPAEPGDSFVKRRFSLKGTRPNFVSQIRADVELPETDRSFTCCVPKKLTAKERRRKEACDNCCVPNTGCCAVAMAQGNAGRFIAMMFLTGGYFLVELIVGYIIQSLSLQADAYHMLSDIIALAIGFAASVMSVLPSTKRFTFGFVNMEVVGALINATFLLSTCLQITLEAAARFAPEELNEVAATLGEEGELLLIVACIGLAINIAGLFIFGHGHSHGGDDHGHSHGGDGHGHSHGGSHDHSDDDDDDSDADADADADADTHGTHGHSHGEQHGHSSHRSHTVADESSAAVVASAEGCSVTRRSIETKSGDEPKSHGEHGHSHGHHGRHGDIEAGCDHDHHHHHHHHHHEEQEEEEDADERKKATGPKNSCCSCLSSASGNMNVQAVMLHVLGDALGSIGVIISALVIMFGGDDYRRCYIDPVMSIVIVIIILTGTIPLFKRTIKVLLHSAPRGFNVSRLTRKILKLDGVREVHDFHAWSLTNSKKVASIHVVMNDDIDFPKLSDKIKMILHAAGIHATTVQPEFVSKDTFLRANDRSTDGQHDVCNEPICGDDCLEEQCCAHTALDEDLVPLAIEADEEQSGEHSSRGVENGHAHSHGHGHSHNN